MERFDRAHSNPSTLVAGTASTTSSTPQTNGYSSAHNNFSSKPKKEARSESKVKSETPSSSTPGGDFGDDSDVVSPPKKKRKHAEGSEELDDAKLAAMLQAQENRFVFVRASLQGQLEGSYCAQHSLPLCYHLRAGYFMLLAVY